jgi:hypothetical protein
MTANAIALERAVAVDQPAFLETVMRLFVGGREETPAAMGARYGKLVIGTAEPLRQSLTEEAFRAAFDLLDGGQFLRDMAGIIASPVFPQVVRLAKVYDLDPRRAVPMNQRALELRDDLAERSALLFGSVPKADLSHEEIAEGLVQGLTAGDEFLLDLGRFCACTSSLTYAAFGQQVWQPWQLGLLWMFGERALKAQAAAMGIPPEAAATKLMTRRERDLMATLPDRATSDEGLALLGLDA